MPLRPVYRGKLTQVNGQDVTTSTQSLYFFLGFCYALVIYISDADFVTPLLCYQECGLLPDSFEYQMRISQIAP